MKARGVVGKRIVRIEQERAYDEFGTLYMNILAIELEDGTRMWPVVGELDGDYAVDLAVVGPGRRRRGHSVKP